MFQAIVFLPLLGAVIAALISLFGAHARNPSGDTVEHHDDAQGHGHGGAPINADAALVHVRMTSRWTTTTMLRLNRRRPAPARPN